MGNNNIEFKAGYYEWNIFLNGKQFFSFGASIDEEIGESTSTEELKEKIDICIEAMQEWLKENNKEPLDEKYIPELKMKMLMVWSYHFLDYAA